MDSLRPGRGQRSRRCSESPPPRLRRGIEQFNRGEFYEQHETLEEEWLAERDPVRYLYQGILQVGVGFEHLRRGNPVGARALWRRGISYLEPFRRGCAPVSRSGARRRTATALSTLASRAQWASLGSLGGQRRRQPPVTTLRRAATSTMARCCAVSIVSARSHSTAHARC